MDKRYTKFASKAIDLAVETAKELGHNYVGTEHLLIGLLRDKDNMVYKVLETQNIKIKDVVDLIIAKSGISVRSCVTAKSMTKFMKKVLENATIIAYSQKKQAITECDILEAICNEKFCTAYKILNKLNFRLDMTINEVISDNNPIQRKFLSERDTPLLWKYGKDMTRLAFDGIFDKVSSRDEEIKRIMAILLRRVKNNPCLVGESGVGKTAIIEGLAQALLQDNAPLLLKNSIIVMIDLCLVISGSKYRGDFEERLSGIIREAANNKNIILFIDEFHTIVGAGAADGAIDASNILKPSLARGEIKLIGATTTSEYRKNIEKDPALSRRMQIVDVCEPTVLQTSTIIEGIAEKYEQHYNVIISKEIIKLAILLSKRYLVGRFLPDKAIDIIDEAASLAIISDKFDNKDKYCLCDDDILQAVSNISKLPLSKINNNERINLINLEQKLKEKIFGQDSAVVAVSTTVLRFKAGLCDENRPIGSFLFLGPTGVGKTHLAKALAEILYDDKDALIKIDMGEFTDSHSVSKLIGSPPGFVGYEDGGYLLESVANKPYSIVLFDEIEKAHPDVLNILLSLLDEGVVKSSNGEIINFKNTIIVMTSNIGAREINFSKKMGFVENEFVSNKAIEGEVLSVLKRTIKPEILNRIDKTIVFSKLTLEDIKLISQNQLTIIKKRLANLNIEADFSENVALNIAKLSFDRNFGARNLKRKIQSLIEDRLSFEIINQNILPHSQIYIDFFDDNIKIESIKNISCKV